MEQINMNDPERQLYERLTIMFKRANQILDEIGENTGVHNLTLRHADLDDGTSISRVLGSESIDITQVGNQGGELSQNKLSLYQDQNMAINYYIEIDEYHDWSMEDRQFLKTIEVEEVTHEQEAIVLAAIEASLGQIKDQNQTTK